MIGSSFTLLERAKNAEKAGNLSLARALRSQAHEVKQKEKSGEDTSPTTKVDISKAQRFYQGHKGTEKQAEVLKPQFGFDNKNIDAQGKVIGPDGRDTRLKSLHQSPPKKRLDLAA